MTTHSKQQHRRAHNVQLCTGGQTALYQKLFIQPIADDWGIRRLSGGIINNRLNYVIERA